MANKPRDGLRVKVGIAFQSGILATLDEYSKKCFEANRNQAINCILEEYFILRKQGITVNLEKYYKSNYYKMQQATGA